MLRSLSALSLASLVLAGCQPRPPAAVTMFNTFQEADYRPYQGNGPGRIEGQAFLRQQGGGVVTCAGEGVIAFPATPYTRELTALAARQQAPSQPAPSMLAAVTRTARCDAQGRFRFEGLRPGRWMVVAQVRWVVANVPQGGGMVRELDVPQQGELILSDADRAP